MHKLLVTSFILDITFLTDEDLHPTKAIKLVWVSQNNMPILGLVLFADFLQCNST